jgi:hypothetical protein
MLSRRVQYTEYYERARIEAEDRAVKKAQTMDRIEADILAEKERAKAEESRLHFGMQKSIWMKESYQGADFRKDEKVYPWMRKVYQERIPLMRLESRKVQDVFRTISLDLIKYLKAEYDFHRGIKTREEVQDAYDEANKMATRLTLLFIDVPMSRPSPHEVLTSRKMSAYFAAVYGATVEEKLTNIWVWKLQRRSKTAGIFTVAFLANLLKTLEDDLNRTIAAAIAAGRPNPYPTQVAYQKKLREEIDGEINQRFNKIAKGDSNRITDDARALPVPLIGFVEAIRMAARALFTSKPSKVYGEALDSINETQTALSTLFGAGASIYANSLAPSRAVKIADSMDHLSTLFNDFVRSIRHVMETLYNHGYRGNALSDASMKCIGAAERIGRVMDDYGMSGHKY